MLQKPIQIIKHKISIWHGAALPGIALILITIFVRLSGSLQFLEWMLLDNFLKMRPSEPVDEKVVIVGINEDDIQKIGKYPIPDREIASLIEKIQSYEPSIIGLDIFKDIPVEPGSKQLHKVLKNSKNIIGIDKVLYPDKISPPASLSKEKIGFVDIIPDQDGKYRRYLLMTPSPDNPDDPKQDKFSLSLRLATAYLAAEKNITIENGIQDSNAIRFGSTELPVFDSNSGGYVDTDNGGIQIFMNFRNGKERFRVLSLHDIKNNQVNPSWLQGKIILIGMTATTVRDITNTSAISGLKLNGEIYGVEYHAHATSQIINAVINKRPLLQTWSDNWEYLWIIIWGFVPIVMGNLLQSVWNNLLAVSVSSICLIAAGYLFLVWWGLWIPVVPGLLIFLLNGVVLNAFFQQNRTLKSKIQERQRTIEHTFTIIHNGPLQTLADALSHLRTQEFPQEKLILQLETLNHEIRDIGEFMKREALSNEHILRLGSGLILDLNNPVNELLYEVYTSTLQRKDLKYLSAIRVKTRSFEPIDDKYLNIELKRELCQFLEESLCNIGKHAQGAKRIQVIGKIHDECYSLSVKDNGCGINSSTESKGTKQCKDLAQRLSGTFKRQPVSPKGTLCELTWRLKNQKNHLKINSLCKVMLSKLGM
ncbi:CHASE2 domain-containing protein [Plectonema cf. radiosum LEGE 06105]|uniref:CHASE2 domain-containing protein n=1 Tax=Plectonema cf. radiosum LEGE 06105 TaxID=945769 RepID=A0A8J7FC83_9CYAN|nr:CHASE2 domain-containing protein [Plectonema radiosum]MBE9215749.1 CHASE2 domain-containing protein [Plectonema cf. radiosum LEGE 06105]